MRKSGLLFKIPCVFTVFFLLLSCHTYEEIRIYKSLKLDEWSVYVSGKNGSADLPGKTREIYITKYLANVSSPAPLAEINGMAVKYALEGRFIEAERLFMEAAAEYPSSPVPLNNLGVVYEIFGKRDKAADYYLRASIIEPDNRYFRKNFISFDDTGM